MTSTELLVDTPVGEGRWLLHRAPQPHCWLALGHGAGSGFDAADLAELATELPTRRVAVALFEQPWLRAGKKVAARPAALDQAWLAAVRSLIDHQRIDPPDLVVGGRSAGARVACRTADQLGAPRVVNLAFPLHPPGAAEKSRLHELTDASARTLTLQGERDPFGGAAELLAALVGTPAGQHTVVAVPRAAHNLRMPASVVREPGFTRLIPDTVAGFLLD